MRFGLKTGLLGVCLALSLAVSSQAAFDLSIGNISVNGAGGSFTVFATARTQAETVGSYTLKLNLTGTSAGELAVSFPTEGGAAAGFSVADTNTNTVISALNGAGVGVGGNTVGFSAFVLGGGVPFALNTATAVGTFSFTTADGFTAGNFIDVGFVFGSTADTTFGTATVPSTQIPLTAIGGTNVLGNNPGVATSTRIAVAVPEPSTFGVLSLVGVAFGMRRKRRLVNC